VINYKITKLSRDSLPPTVSTLLSSHIDI